jgi:hypothetical protein
MDLRVVMPEFQAGMTADFSLGGTCPHCRDRVSFSSAERHQPPYSEPIKDEPLWRRWYPVMRCAGCSKFILAVLKVKETEIHHGMNLQRVWEMRYETHYPVGTPDDSVDAAVPENIAADFREALRCRWVDGYNATVEMCRRALEASCLDLGAKPRLSITQKIDWVHKQGRINKTLKNVAHKIRLGGNRGSHPMIDPKTDSPVTPDEADAVLEFTRHYLDHVYVVEKRLARYDFSRSGRKAASQLASPTPQVAALPTGERKTGDP